MNLSRKISHSSLLFHLLGAVLFFSSSLVFVNTSIAQEKSTGPSESKKGKSDSSKLPDKASPISPQTIVVVQGAGGSKEYQRIFSEACKKIQAAAKKSNSEFFWIGQPDADNKTKSNEGDKQQLQKLLELQAKNVADSKNPAQLWLIFIGHGTFDRRLAKFNLRGPDVSAKELNEWLSKVRRPTAIVNCASASAPFINRLTAKGRVIVTATKSGFELNYSRFGVYFANALTDLSADIDKDEQVSLLESFLFASRKVEEFYKSESRLATEHALIDDNGDGKGTPLEFFRGIRVIKKSENDGIPDGPFANQIHLIQSEFEKLLSIENRNTRKELEDQLERLRLRKSEMAEDDYFDELEKIALQLSKLYQQIESKSEKDKQEGKSLEPRKEGSPDQSKKDLNDKKADK